jgi:hypothetical protein
MAISKEAKDFLFLDYDRAKGSRSNFEWHWQEAAELIHPIESSFTKHSYQGENKRYRIFDGTGELANQQLAAGLFSLLTNPSQPFFELSTEDKKVNESWAVADWLQQVTEIMNYEIQLPRTNFTAALSESYLEYGAFGNCQLLISEHPEVKRALFFQSLPLTETCFQESRANIVNRILRLYKRTAFDLVEEFGEKNVSEDVRKAVADKKGDTEFEVLHTIRPVDEAKGFMSPRGFKRFSYIGLYIEKKTKNVLRETGYYERPFAVARFYKASSEVYGRGPGFAALSDVKMLQEIYQTTLSGAQKRVDPAVMMPDDGFLSVLDTRPGAVNFYQAGTQDRVEPLHTNSDPNLGEELAAGVRKRIWDAFYISQLQLNIGPQMTATEVMQRVEQQMRMLGPLVGRLQTELLGPMIQRCFKLLLRMDKFPPVPEKLLERGNILKIVYTTPMARAQDQLQANNLTRTLQVLEPFIGIDPTIMDNFNNDEIAQGIGEVFSVSKRFYNAPAIRENKRMQRQQAAEAERQAQILRDGGQGAMNLANAAQTLEDK